MAHGAQVHQELRGEDGVDSFEHFLSFVFEDCYSL
jgi:hypothetical protein